MRSCSTKFKTHKTAYSNHNHLGTTAHQRTTMRFLNKSVFLFLGIAATASLANAFVSPSLPAVSNCRNTMGTLQATASTNDDDRGNENVILKGKPTPKAKALDARKVLHQHSVQNAQGKSISMDELLGQDGTSIAVFLRSLG